MFPRDFSRKDKTDVLLAAYRSGLFPMADARSSPHVRWINPERRGILPLREFNRSRSLRRTLRRKLYRVTFDLNFKHVIQGCANREETWINNDIMAVYTDLYEQRIAHSVECWSGHRLVGGLYGISIGAAFFGESMFSRSTDASKVALSHLVDRLLLGGYILLDVQFLTEHLRKLGAIEVDRKKYLCLLDSALNSKASF